MSMTTVPSHGYLSSTRRSSRSGSPRTLVAALLLILVASLLPGRAPDAAAARQVHVKVRGHIVALSPQQLKVRDRHGVLHVVLLTPTTTYWHKLDHKAFGDLKMAMRVYVLGVPNPDGTVTALRVHLYYPRAHISRKHRSHP
ncbi:MAG: hypothetical protein NVSMB65_15900 [Chloroflexota bacterium]